LSLFNERIARKARAMGLSANGSSLKRDKTTGKTRFELGLSAEGEGAPL